MAMRYRYEVNHELYEVDIERQGDRTRAMIGGHTYEVEVLEAGEGQLSLRFAGRPVTVQWAAENGEKWLSVHGCTYRLERPSNRPVHLADDFAGGAAVRSPMPAQVRAVQVSETDGVEKGQVLLLLEAMKMEIRVRTPVAGRVKKLLVSTGQTVEKDQLLAEIEEESNAR